MNSKQVMDHAADNIRILAASMVEKAKSGHPGGAMGVQPLSTSCMQTTCNTIPKIQHGKDATVFSSTRVTWLRCYIRN